MPHIRVERGYTLNQVSTLSYRVDMNDLHYEVQGINDGTLDTNEFLVLTDEDSEEDPSIPHILCGKCHNSEFTLQYGTYELIAICKCGNKMSVYSG